MSESTRNVHARAADNWVKPYLKAFRRPLVLAIVLGLATFLCASLLMFTSGYLISFTASPEADLFLIMTPIAFVQIFGLGKPIARYFERLISHDWVFRMTSGLRRRLYRAIEREQDEANGARAAGDYLGTLAEDIGHLQNLFLRVIFPATVALLLYVVVVIALGAFSWRFGLAMLLLFGVVVILLPLVSYLVNRARIERTRDLARKLYTELSDDVFGAVDWVYAGRGEECVRRSMASEKALRELQMSSRRSQRILDLVAAVVLGIGVCLTVGWAGTAFADTAADFIAAFALAFFPLIEAFAPLSDTAQQAVACRSSVDRLNAYADPGASSRAREDAAEVARGLANADAVDVHIEHASFAYPGAPRLVLDDVTLNVAAGEHVAILGRSGSGKSTLVGLVRGALPPKAGSVRLNDIEVRSLGEQAAQVVGTVEQGAYLFYRTLRENLTLGAPDATDTEIWEVLREVRLEEMVRRLPQGLDTLVDETGARFSGGERSRIALARVLLARTPIIVLDEPTVGLDPATEHALMDTLFEVAADKTLIMVTHHLQDVEKFDRVLFVEDGAIALEGTPTQLARESERYRALLKFDRGQVA